MFANHGVRFGIAAIGARTTTEIEGRMKKILWIWDNRKTQATTEAKSVKEAMQVVFRAIRNCANVEIEE